MMRYRRIEAIRYRKGYSYPVENEVVIDSDANYNQSLLERDVDKLWVTAKDHSQLIKYVFYGVIALAVIFIIMQFFKGKPPS